MTSKLFHPSIGLALGMALLTPPPAIAQAAETYPDIRLTYADLALDTPTGRQAFVRRVETTAQAHCARFGPRIVPHARRGQPRFCFSGVRAEILQDLPPPLRAAYDDGLRQEREEMARGRSVRP